MGSFVSRFKTNKSLEDEGAWVDLGEGVKIKVRRFSSRASRELRKKLEKPHQHLIRRGELPEDIAENILIRQMAGSIITDWEGVTDEAGNSVSCNPAQAFKIFTEFPEFRDEVAAAALNRDNFKDQEREESEKNS